MPGGNELFKRRNRESWSAAENEIKRRWHHRRVPQRLRPHSNTALTAALKRCATQNQLAFQSQNYQTLYHSPAFTSFLILRLMRSRFSALT